MNDLAEQFIIFDLEWTTWEGAEERQWSGPNEYREVVEIGAIKVNGKTLEEIGSFDRYVRPQKNQQLSEFFITLTGITQEKIEKEGVDFAAALKDFFGWCQGLPIYSWGVNDPKVLKENSTLAGIPFPFKDDQFFNMRDLFKNRGIPADEYTSGTITKAFGKDPLRRAHSGINDSRTILDGLRYLEAAHSLVK
jgi:inhibitor of KinA sporulation pathway (predicted exonuclease)